LAAFAVRAADRLDSAAAPGTTGNERPRAADTLPGWLVRSDVDLTLELSGRTPPFRVLRLVCQGPLQRIAIRRGFT